MNPTHLFYLFAFATIVPATGILLTQNRLGKLRLMVAASVAGLFMSTLAFAAFTQTVSSASMVVEGVILLIFMMGPMFYAMLVFGMTKDRGPSFYTERSEALSTWVGLSVIVAIGIPALTLLP